MEQETKRYGHRSIYIFLVVSTVIGAIIMYKIGVHATGMSDTALELNKLLDQKVKTCGSRQTEKCLEANKALEDFEKKHNVRRALPYEKKIKRGIFSTR